MKETKSFYKTKQWKQIQAEVMKRDCYLCQRCIAEGRYSRAEIVHHKEHLNGANVNDPSVALNAENLEALCRECHGKEHRTQKRYIVDESGRVLIAP